MIQAILASVPVQIGLLSAISLALIAAAVYILLRIRRNPRDKEKRRRLAVNLHGRLGDATITDVEQNIVFYQYSVRGVIYTASQDISQLRERIPADPERLIGGAASLKYSPRNPANSILVCEEWSGLRVNIPQT